MAILAVWRRQQQFAVLNVSVLLCLVLKKWRSRRGTWNEQESVCGGHLCYSDGHKNPFWSGASLNHQNLTTTPSLFTSSAFTSITHTLHALSGENDLLPSVFVQNAARIYQSPNKSKANNIQHGHVNSPPLCRFYTTTLTRLLRSKTL